MTDSNRVDNGQFFEMDSICIMSEDEFVSIRKLQTELNTATATLERVRAIVPKQASHMSAAEVGLLQAALAGSSFTEGKLFQPEAHLAKQNENELLMTAPKGQEKVPLVEWQKMERDLAAANARIAESQADIPKAEAYIKDLNEKYAVLESSHDRVSLALRRAEARADAAEKDADHLRKVFARELARADAAERRADDATKLVEHTRELHNICDRGLVAAWAERDQLAARVKDLEEDHEMYQRSRVELYRQACTTEERAVLDAWKLLSEEARESAMAELANRSAKAKVIK
jgi:predicted hydrocarbon binding protein